MEHVAISNDSEDSIERNHKQIVNKINYYIQKNNNWQNVLLLTATPFTNSPLEIFSMLSMIAYNKLRETSLNNIKSFFDTYVSVSTELVINSRLQPQFKQIILGFLQ